MADTNGYLAAVLENVGLPAKREFYFWPGRRFHFDLAYPEVKLAVEIEGGTWSRGRHVRPQGFERDCVKYNGAALQGWTVLRFTTGMVIDGRALETIQQWFEQHKGNKEA